MESVDESGDSPAPKHPRLDEAPAEAPPERVPTMRAIPMMEASMLASTVPSTSYYALELLDRRIIKKLIVIFPPLPNRLAHLKRVGEAGMLMCETEDEVDSILEDLEGCNVFKENVKLVSVPAVKPRTRQQFEYAKNLWPTSFHPNEAFEAILNGKYFDTHVELRYSGLTANRVGCLMVKGNETIEPQSVSGGPLRHVAIELIRQAAANNNFSYLGTGCDVFLHSEPCAMCAMALVHFRVARVFFNHVSENGVLSNGRWQLHLDPSINHHYEVYHFDFYKNPVGRIVCGNFL